MGELVNRLDEISVALLSALWLQYNLFFFVERGDSGIVEEPPAHEYSASLIPFIAASRSGSLNSIVGYLV